MRIGLNATCFNSRPSGAKQRFFGIYARLIKNLKKHEFIIFHSNEYKIEKEFGKYKNVKYVKIDIPIKNSFKKNIINLFKFKNIILNYNLDIIELFNLPIFLPKDLKYIITIHDIRNNYFTYAGISSLFAKIILKFFLKKAYRIITVSNAMKKEINSFYKNNKTDVIYNGIEKNFIKNFKHENQKYILTVGHFEKRKNFISLVHAYALLKKKEKNLKLVILGNANSTKEKKYLLKVKSLIMKNSLEKSVVILNNVKKKKLIEYYKNCYLFISPSIYEGFGITILEAMKSKKIILASNIKVFKEISPKGIIFFNYNSVKSIHKKLKYAIEHKNKLNKKINYNFSRAKKFEFENVSKQLEELYTRKVLNNYF